MKSRLNSLRELSQKRGLDGFLVANEFNMLYLTEFSGGARLLVPNEGENVLYVYGVNYEQAKLEAKDCRVELVKADENLEKKVAEQIEKSKLKKVGFDSMEASTYLKLRKHLRGTAKLKAKAELLWKLRKVKDENELQLMRRAAEITSKGMQAAYEVLRPGMHEYEVAAEIEYAMRKNRSYGLAFETIVASGPRSALPHGWCTEREIREGELVVIDIGAKYKHYHSDMTRTLVAGKPSQKQEKIFQIVKEAQEKAFQSVHPGKKVKDIDSAARDVIEKAGFGKQFVHSLGHGVGLEIHEPPALSQNSKDRLRVGNVVTLEPGIYIVGFGGIRIEDTVLVKKRKPERLTVGPYSLG